jgi:hypothetical protein
MPAAAQPVPEDIAFESAYGITLEGILQLPKGEPRNGVVLCHPHPALGGTMRTPLVVRLAFGLVASGRAVLRFNFRGVGGSEGATTGGELEPLDVAAAVAYLRQRLPVTQPALAGWSFGSLMAMAHARTDPGLSAVAAGAPPLGLMAPPDGLASIHAPLLLVVGDRDPYCPPEALDPLPGGHVVIKGANHFFWAKEDDLIRTVVEFFDRVGA